MATEQVAVQFRQYIVDEQAAAGVRLCSSRISSSVAALDSREYDSICAVVCAYTTHYTAMSFAVRVELPALKSTNSKRGRTIIGLKLTDYCCIDATIAAATASKCSNRSTTKVSREGSIACLCRRLPTPQGLWKLRYR